MIFELCTDSIEGAIAAEKYGFKRIELCSALSVGGLTPSFGLIQQCVKNSSVEVHVMIRPNEGGFQYSKEDVSLMKIDIKAAKKAGAHGVVFGILNPENEVSELNNEFVFLSKSLGLEVTFHRAFDFVSDYNLAIEKLITLGFDRVLTSGLQATAIEGLPLIEKLQANYGSQIQLMAGSGINASNALKFMHSGINNLHFTARRPKAKKIELSMGEEMMVDEDKIKKILNQFQ